VQPTTKIIQDAGLKLQINSIASMFQIFFAEDPVVDYATAKLADNKEYMEFHNRLLSNGIFLPPSQLETCFVSIAHSIGDLKKTVENFRNALLPSA